MPSSPSPFDALLELGRRLIKEAPDDRALRHFAVCAGLLVAEARYARNLATKPPPQRHAAARNIPPAVAAKRLGISVRK